MTLADQVAPQVGDLVRVRGQQWVVAAANTSEQPEDELAATKVPGATMVTLTSVSDDDITDELSLIWEVEPGREILPETRLPTVTESDWDDPQTLGAFLDAVRWGAVASADDHTLQAPFRAGISIEDYQLEPVAKALAMPRVNLLIADDVGLGKTIEAGLVVQEMLLRHRARRILIVSPAPLTGKWQMEMKEKFGLAFEILDAAKLKDLARTHGLDANPFSVFPRSIISLPWLRTPRVQRLLDEVLTPQAQHPGFFDVLIVDEAHHCAPPAPSSGKKYALDSLQTRAVRRLGEYAQHRLFLSATPHNGYPESWQALLEMLDPQRFARGVEPDSKIVQQVMVRRLKDDVVDADGNAKFPKRLPPRAIEVDYTDEEREGHRLLERYTRSRAKGRGLATAKATDLVTLMLKKRLFSSPAAFAHTLAVHRETVRGKRYVDGDVPEWLSEALAWDDDDPADDNDEFETDLLTRAAGLLDEPDESQQQVLDELSRWADRHAEPADTKANALVEELRKLGSDERVIIFTEYRTTQNWLAELLDARGFGSPKLGLIYGGMDTDHREYLKAAFQADPSRNPLRILLATDAAGEGIDLQEHCHRVINYDIPFNPNRLEQRIGRVDRFGQRHEVDVAHFVGTGWQNAAAGSYEADLEFLSRVAAKVATERRDLGSVNPVLAHAVEAHMLGRPNLIDPLQVKPKPSTSAVRAERALREQAQRLRTQLDTSIETLHVAPANVRRVVDVALHMASQPSLVDCEPGIIDPPQLRAGWERTLTGLEDPLDGHLRPLSFDAAVVENRDDVVLAHLGHPLVAQSSRLLRSAIWAGRPGLHRIAAVTYDPPVAMSLRGPLVTVFARMVVVGHDGTRLHEEIIMAGREVPESGRGKRLDLEKTGYADLRQAVDAALEPGACLPAPQTARTMLAQRWEQLTAWLQEDIALRAQQQRQELSRLLESHRVNDIDRTNGIFDQLRLSLQIALDGSGEQQLSFDDLDDAERRQFDRDRRSWQERLDRLDDDRSADIAAIERRYQSVRELVFPFAVALCVPRGSAASAAGLATGG